MQHEATPDVVYDFGACITAKQYVSIFKLLHIDFVSLVEKMFTANCHCYHLPTPKNKHAEV